jgi:AAA domain/Toprim-like
VNAEELLSRLKNVDPPFHTKPAGPWKARCPSHDDPKNSLSIADQPDKILIRCFAGCSSEQIVTALQLRLADLFKVARQAGSPNGSRAPGRLVKAYDYRAVDGTLLYQNCRFDPKTFRVRRPDGAGWRWNLGNVKRVVYRLPELAEQRRVFLVEGEKDVDSLWLINVPATTGACGAEGWRSEYSDQLRAAGGDEVVILPDNDEPGRKYARAAAASLRGVGIAVRILELPGLAPKGDVSDWLAAGHTREELLALAEHAEAFVAAVEETAGAQLVREGLDLALVWPAERVRFALAAIRDGRDGVRGELTVTQGARRLSWGSFATASTQTREALRKKLEAAAPELPWGEYLEEMAWRFTQAARQGEPLVTLTGMPTSPTRELMPQFLYEGEPTLLFGDGDTGKSLVALALAAAVHGGVALPHGLKPLQAVPAAYLDWETSRDTLEGRLGLLAAGLGIAPPPLLYKRMTRPLVDEVVALAAEFARCRIGLIVIDSKMFAVAGGDGAAFHEPITAFYGALRLFAPAASLVLNHVTNADARDGGPARPFGGAFAFNGPRLIWEAKRDPDVTDATAIAFTCRKANNLPRKPEPFGLRFQPAEDTITVQAFDLTAAAPHTVAGASLPYRVRLALATSELTIAELAEHLGVSEESVGRVVRRLASSGGLVKVDDAPSAGGRGHAARWRLAAR